MAAIEPEIVGMKRKRRSNFKFYKVNGIKAILFLITLIYFLVKMGWAFLMALLDPVLLVLIALNILVWKLT